MIEDSVAEARRFAERAPLAARAGWRVPYWPWSPAGPADTSAQTGCAIYDTRPEKPCRTFSCAWLLDDVSYPEAMRPDRSKVILSDVGEWEGWRVISAAPVGDQIPEHTLGVLRDFCNASHSALLYYNLERLGEQFTGRGNQHAYGPPGVYKSISGRVRTRHELLANGPSVVSR